MKFLSVEHISHSFKDLPVLKDVSFTVEKGECAALMGESGSGKTTMLRIIAGLLRPDEGRVLINDTDVTMKAPSERNLAMVFQSAALFPHTSVHDNMIYGLHKLGLSDGEIEARVLETSKMLKIEDQLKKYPRTLSGGQAQRVNIARALIRRPELFLLDEPFSSLDKELKYELIDEMLAIQKQTGMAMVYVTHDGDEAERFSARIIALKKE